jgi:hypothetical protein
VEFSSRSTRSPSEVHEHTASPWLVVAVLVVALVSTAGWALSARRTATAGQATAVEAQPHQHGGASNASGISQGHGGTAQNTPPIAPRDGLVP